MGVTSETAVPIVEQALKEEGIPVTPRRVWAVLVTARAESGYGTGWKTPPHGPEAPSSKNWGAVQAPGTAAFQYLGKTKPTGPAPASGDPSKYFYALDYNPYHKNDDGTTGSWFWGPYRVYATDVLGAREVARLLQKKGALDAAEAEGTTDAVARASYGYYTGMTTDKEKQIGIRAEQLQTNADAIAKLLGVEPVLVRSGTTPTGTAVPGKPQPTAPVVGAVSSGSDLPSELPTLRFGSAGPAVEMWQRLLNRDPNRAITLEVDGAFGKQTRAATMHWQALQRDLHIDGVVGPISWSRMPS